MPHSRHIDQLQQQAANSLSLHKVGIHPPPHFTATMTTSSTHGSLPLDVRNNPKCFGETEVLKGLTLQVRHHPHRRLQLRQERFPALHEPAETAQRGQADSPRRAHPKPQN